MPPAILILSSDDDAPPAPSTSKPKPKTTPKATPKTKVKAQVPDSDEEMAPAPKSKPAVKRKSVVVETDESSEEDVKPQRPKGSPVKKAVAEKKQKDKFIDDDDDDEDEKSGAKGKASSSKPAAKKVKGEDGAAAPAKKWVFKAKAGEPVNAGSKDVPKGKDNCLAGLTFVFTGEMTAFSREQMQDMAKRFGGRVTGAVSGKTSYVVLGSEPGPKKLEMIAKNNLKTLDEDGFLALIGSRPSGKDDPKVVAAKKKEEEQIVKDAKTIGLAKDAPEHHTQLWTTKYAPTKLSEICGNKAAVTRLSTWLEAWPKSLASDFKKPGPDAMGGFRCVLISGPPGIGKTTAAHLVAKLQGFDILELNASDVRSKKLLESAFKSKIDNTSLAGFLKTSSSGGSADPSTTKKSVIIMDEVDGMSAGDRGGVGALNMLIKKSKVPIIAICNDKSNPKMKPLAATCFQMIFKRPMATEIRGRMMTVAFKEGMKLDGQVLDQLVAGSQSDIRQIVNMLSTWKLGAKTMDFDEGKKLAIMSAKNATATPWTLYGKLFNPQAFSAVSGMTLNDKIDLYFNDHSMMPLFVQENYLKNNFSRTTGLSGNDLVLKRLELASQAADSISDGDLVDGLIHSGQQWSLMPLHGVLSTVRPASFCYGSGSSAPQFSAWFGKNSTSGKLQRMLGELQIRMRLRVSGDRKEIRQSYLSTLWLRLVLPLQHPDAGSDDIHEVIKLMDEYFLTKDDWDAIVEFGIGQGYAQEGVLKLIDSKVKGGFTRTYNSMDHPAPFPRHGDTGKPARKIAGGPPPDQEDVMLEDDDGSDEEAAGSGSGDDATAVIKDKMIKQKKTKGAKAVKAPAKKK